MIDPSVNAELEFASTYQWMAVLKKSLSFSLRQALLKFCHRLSKPLIESLGGHEFTLLY